MAEQVFGVAAGGTTVYEVVKSEAGLKLTLRMASNPAHAITMPSNAVHALIGALQLFVNTPQPGPDTN